MTQGIAWTNWGKFMLHHTVIHKRSVKQGLEVIVVPPAPVQIIVELNRNLIGHPVRPVLQNLELAPFAVQFHDCVALGQPCAQWGGATGNQITN